MKSLTRHLVGGAVLGLLFLGGATVGHADTIVFDDFNDNSLNASLWMPVFGGGGGMVGIVDQKLRVTARPFGGEGTGAGARLMGTIVGDFDVQVAYSLPWPLLVEEGLHVGIYLGTALGELGYGVARDTTWDSPNSCTSTGRQSYVGASSASSQARVCTSDLSGALRYTREEGILSAYYYGPSDWIRIATFDTPVFEPLTFLGLAAMNAGFGTVRVNFDDFWLKADEFTPIPEPASLLLLATGLAGLVRVARRRRQ